MLNCFVSYLCQKPPEDSAIVFAPGIISTSQDEALFGIFNLTPQKNSYH